LPLKSYYINIFINPKNINNLDNKLPV
jgi:hypothetical protein